MSHQTSRMVERAPAEMSVVMKRSNSAQSFRDSGSPAVGRASKTLLRLEARPVSNVSQ